MPDLHVVILAAGKGTRMKSALPKVLHPVAGSPMIEYVLRAAATLDPRSITVIVGHDARRVKTALERPGLTFVVQRPQRGTAHALLSASRRLEGSRGTLVCLSGDVPLLRAATLSDLLTRHTRQKAAMTVLSAVLTDPSGYGRVVRAADEVARIVEERDATPEERAIREVNAGVYAFRLEGLFEALRRLAATNAQREYYLPDLVAAYRERGLLVQSANVTTPDEILGINSRAELAEASRHVRHAKATELMAAGVTIEDPSTTYIDESVSVGADTVLHPAVFLEGTTVVGCGCHIHSGARIVDSTIGDGAVVLNHCVISNATIGQGARVGPFAHLRPGTLLNDTARVGNFVELKKTVLGRGSKSMHLAYLGDAVIGEGVNIGAGTITCNYDGASKHVTTIEDGVFIGSDTQIVAPLTVGKDAYVGTGTTLREDVPAGALAVSAGKQRNIEGWVARRRAKARAPKRKPRA